MARPRQRPRPASEPTPPPTGPADDLFAHYGVVLEPRAARAPRPVVEVVACSHCGWWIASAAAARALPCPLCGSSP